MKICSIMGTCGWLSAIMFISLWLFIKERDPLMKFNSILSMHSILSFLFSSSSLTLLYNMLSTQIISAKEIEKLFFLLFHKKVCYKLIL